MTVEQQMTQDIQVACKFALIYIYNLLNILPCYLFNELKIQDSTIILPSKNKGKVVLLIIASLFYVQMVMWAITNSRTTMWLSVQVLPDFSTL